MPFFIFVIVAFFIALRWIISCLTINQYRLNSVWDVFYISTFFIISLSLLYFNFYSDFLISGVMVNSICFGLLGLLFVLDWEIDLYFDDLQMED